MNMKKILTKNAKQTEMIGYQIGSLLEAGDLVLLEGDLGGGKTTFTKGLARALNISETINSPTFTIVKIYRGKYNLNHIDAYRLEGSDDDIGLDELINDEDITVIEWPEYILEFLPKSFLKVTFEYINEFERYLLIDINGSKNQQRFKEYL